MLIPKFLIGCIRYDRGLYLRGQLEDRFAFIGMCQGQETPLTLGERTTAEELRIEKEFTTEGCPRMVRGGDREKSAWSDLC
jgi:hypothetical protein